MKNTIFLKPYSTEHNLSFTVIGPLLCAKRQRERDDLATPECLHGVISRQVAFLESHLYSKLHGCVHGGGGGGGDTYSFE